MRYLTFAFLLLFTISCASTGSRYSLDSDFYYNQVTQHNVIDMFVMKPDVVRELNRTPALLRPSESDYLTIETDLNGDGKLDILAAVDSYKFDVNKKHKLFIFIKDDYSYTQLKPFLLIDTYNLKVLHDVSNGMRNLQAGSKVFHFDGSNYK